MMAVQHKQNVRLLLLRLLQLVGVGVVTGIGAVRADMRDISWSSSLVGEDSEPSFSDPLSLQSHDLEYLNTFKEYKSPCFELLLLSLAKDNELEVAIRSGGAEQLVKYFSRQLSSTVMGKEQLRDQVLQLNGLERHEMWQQALSDLAEHRFNQIAAYADDAVAVKEVRKLYANASDSEEDTDLDWNEDNVDTIVKMIESAWAEKVKVKLTAKMVMSILRELEEEDLARQVERLTGLDPESIGVQHALKDLEYYGKKLKEDVNEARIAMDTADVEARNAFLESQTATKMLMGRLKENSKALGHLNSFDSRFKVAVMETLRFSEALYFKEIALDALQGHMKQLNKVIKSLELPLYYASRPKTSSPLIELVNHTITAGEGAGGDSSFEEEEEEEDDDGHNFAPDFINLPTLAPSFMKLRELREELVTKEFMVLETKTSWLEQMDTATARMVKALHSQQDIPVPEEVVLARDTLRQIVGSTKLGDAMESVNRERKTYLAMEFAREKKFMTYLDKVKIYDQFLRVIRGLPSRVKSAFLKNEILQSKRAQLKNLKSIQE